MVAVSGLGGIIVLYRTSDLTEIVRYDGHRGAVQALHFTLDNNYLVSGGEDETLRVWPAKEASQIGSVPKDTLVMSQGVEELGGQPSIGTSIRTYAKTFISTRPRTRRSARNGQ
jgi:WD40 repeat protein